MFQTVGQTNGGSPGWLWFEPAVKYQIEIEQLGDLAEGTKAEQRIKWKKKYDESVAAKNAQNGKQK